MELDEVSDKTNLLNIEEPEPVRLSRNLLYQAISTEFKLARQRLESTVQKLTSALLSSFANRVSVNFSSNIRSKLQKHGPTLLVLLLVFFIGRHSTSSSEINNQKPHENPEKVQDHVLKQKLDLGETTSKIVGNNKNNANSDLSEQPTVDQILDAINQNNPPESIEYFNIPASEILRNYKSNMTLRDWTIDCNVLDLDSTTSNLRKTVFLLAGHRTGSSFIGDIFNERNDVFYVYEPLTALKMEDGYPGFGCDRRIKEKTKMLMSYAKCTFPGQKVIWNRQNCKGNFCFRTHSKKLCEPPFCDHVWYNYSRTDNANLEQRSEIEKLDVIENTNRQPEFPEYQDSESLMNYQPSTIFKNIPEQPSESPINQHNSETEELDIYKPFNFVKRAKRSDWKGPLTWDPNRCNKYCREDIEISKAANVCRKQALTAIKTIRFCQIADFQPLLTQLNSRVVVLHRDPRAVFSSRVKSVQRKKSDITLMMERAITKHCQVMLQNWRITDRDI